MLGLSGVCKGEVEGKSTVVDAAVGKGLLLLLSLVLLALFLFLFLFRDLIVSRFNEIGRACPCNFKKRPQALQRIWPSSSRRQRGVVLVWQFWQVGEVEREEVGPCWGNFDLGRLLPRV